MPEFQGSHEETFTVPVSMETAKAHYGGLDAIIANYPNLEKGEKVLTMVPVRDFNADHYLVMATRKGQVVRNALAFRD